MRPVPVFTEAYSVATASPSPSTSAIVNGFGPNSTWHSPVPYLFGGIAAIMGTIALALLILACSYWKLSGFLDSDTSNGEPGSDNAEGEKGSSSSDVGHVVQQTVHVVVIMAGQEKPTYLATPVEKKKKNEDEVTSDESTEEKNDNGENESLRVEEEERGIRDHETSPDESV